MGDSGYLGASSFAVQVDGYTDLPECAQDPVTSAFEYNAYLNCAVDDIGPVYVSCLCSKNGADMESAIVSNVVSDAHCANGEASEAVSFFSKACSSAFAYAADAATSSGAATSQFPAPASSITFGPAPTSSSTGPAPSSSTVAAAGETPPGPSGGVIAGIVVGVVVFVAALAGFGLYCVRRNRGGPDRTNDPAPGRPSFATNYPNHPGAQPDVPLYTYTHQPQPPVHMGAYGYERS